MAEQFPPEAPQVAVPQPVPPARSNNRWIIIVIIIVAVLVLGCICTVIAIPSILMAVNTSLSTVFSGISSGLE